MSLNSTKGARLNEATCLLSRYLSPCWISTLMVDDMPHSTTMYTSSKKVNTSLLVSTMLLPLKILSRSIASKEVSVQVKQREMSDVCHGMPMYSSVTLPGERCMSKDVCSTASKYSVRRRVQQQPKIWEASIGETLPKWFLPQNCSHSRRKQKNYIVTS